MKRQTEIEAPGNWFQVDFHVHSPASYDFQGKGRDDSGYIWLLEESKSSEIDVIVITDHNDIAGYLKLIDLEDDLRKTIKTLERTGSPVPTRISEQISLFDQVVVLPGVEIDVYPNIHLIIVFDPNKSDEISSFLDNAGYTLDVRGDETSSKNCKWNIDQALQESEKIGAIVIAAHVDSDKGLYEASKRWGQNRITAFCDERLFGMEFINPIARDQIESIMQSKDYARNNRLAFVQSSDFHGKPGQKIGDRRTFIRMDHLDKKEKSKLFQELKKAFRNPDELISAPGRPELQAILKKLEDKPSIECLVNDDDYSRLAQVICAYANTEDGTIVIGRNLKGNWVGQTEKSEDEFAEKILTTVNRFITPQPQVDLKVYSYYGSNYIASLRVKKYSRICILNSNDKIYLIKNGKPELASSKEIIDMAEVQIIERYAHLSITNKLSDMSKKIMGVEDSIDVLPIVRKIDNDSVIMRTVFEIPKLGEILTDENRDFIEMSGNGIVDGNIISLAPTRPRFAKHYLRITAPIGHCHKSEEIFDETSRYSGEKILIAPGGGVYYDSHEHITVTCEAFPPIIFLKIHEEYNKLSVKFVAAYLKSSIAIWYAERCLGSSDITRKAIIAKIPIPVNVDLVNKKRAEKILDDLMILEYEFLRVEADLSKQIDSADENYARELKDRLEQETDRHNNEANSLVNDIDRLFYQFFDLSEKEISIVEQVLRASGLAIFPDTGNPD